MFRRSAVHAGFLDAANVRRRGLCRGISSVRGRDTIGEPESTMGIPRMVALRCNFDRYSDRISNSEHCWRRGGRTLRCCCVRPGLPVEDLEHQIHGRDAHDTFQVCRLCHAPPPPGGGCGILGGGRRPPVVLWRVCSWLGKPQPGKFWRRMSCNLLPAQHLRLKKGATSVCLRTFGGRKSRFSWNL